MASSKEYLMENLDIFDFTLADEDMNALLGATSPPDTPSFVCSDAKDSRIP